MKFQLLFPAIVCLVQMEALQDMLGELKKKFHCLSWKVFFYQTSLSNMQLKKMKEEEEGTNE